MLSSGMVGWFDDNEDMDRCIVWNGEYSSNLIYEELRQFLPDFVFVDSEDAEVYVYKFHGESRRTHLLDCEKESFCLNLVTNRLSRVDTRYVYEHFTLAM